MILKIGHRDISVIPMTPSESETLGAWGQWEPAHGLIRIAAHLAPTEQVRILLHEIIHACWNIYRLPKRVDEEMACERLDRALATVFRDNAEVLGVIHQGLSNGVPVVAL